MVYVVCVGLCCSGALRGLCGFCARVELGGLKACGVFASIFSPFVSVFALLLCSLPALLWLSSCLVLFVFVFLWVLCFLFPLRYIRKKGRNFFASSLGVLWVCLVVQILVTLSKNSVAVALARSNSFGW